MRSELVSGGWLPDSSFERCDGHHETVDLKLKKASLRAGLQTYRVVPNLEAELGLALMFASAIPTLPWVRLFPFAALLVLAAVTFAWWGFLARLIRHWI